MLRQPGQTVNAGAGTAVSLESVVPSFGQWIDRRYGNPGPRNIDRNQTCRATRSIASYREGGWNRVVSLPMASADGSLDVEVDDLANFVASDHPASALGPLDCVVD